jgi:hypothetical protein
MDLSALEKIIKSDFNKPLELEDQNIFSILKDCCAIKIDNFDETVVIPNTIYTLLIYLQCDITKENCEAIEKEYIANSSCSCCAEKKYPFYTRLRNLAKEIDICASFIKNDLNDAEVEEIFHHHKKCFRIDQNLKPGVTDFSLRFKDNTWMHLEVVSVHSKIQKEYCRFQKDLFKDLDLSESEKNTLLHKAIIEDQDMQFAPEEKKTETVGRFIMKLKFTEYYMQHMAQKIVKITNANKEVNIRNSLKKQYEVCILNLLNLTFKKYHENMRGKSILSIINEYLKDAINNPISGVTVGDSGKESLFRDIEKQITNKNSKRYTINTEYKQHPQGNIMLVGLRRFDFENNLKEYLKNHLKISSDFFSEVYIYNDTEKLLSVACK